MRRGSGAKLKRQGFGGVVREFGGVARGGLEPAERAGDDVCRDLRDAAERAADEQFRQERTAGDRGDAAARAKARRDHAPRFDPNGQPKQVSADGIGDLDDIGGTSQISGIPRMFEMIQNGGTEHGEQYGKGRDARQGAELPPFPDRLPAPDRPARIDGSADASAHCTQYRFG